MDGDEVFALIASIILTARGTWQWVKATGSFHQKRNPHLLEFILLLTAPTLLMVLFPVLQHTAAKEVRDNVQYVVLFTFAGGAWMTIANLLMHTVGVDLTGDAIHRSNPASAIVGIGALLGISISFAGANVGEGATIWTTFFPAAMSLTLIFVLWHSVQRVSDIAYAVTIDRDVASSIRLAGLLVAIGIVFVKPSAGDWVSAEATVRDFATLGWPALPMALGIALLQRKVRPALNRPTPNILMEALFPAIAVNIFAIAWLMRGHS